MRILFRLISVFALGAFAWAASLPSLVSDFAFTIRKCIREVIIPAHDFFPRVTSFAQPIRRIWLAATALNGRQVGGVRVHGFLGHPAVRMLAG